MYETLKNIIAEKELGILCRLYDGDTIAYSSGNSSTRVSTQNTCVSLGGFIQVKNFLGDLYPAMAATQNGFEQRFLYAVVKPRQRLERRKPFVCQVQ